MERNSEGSVDRLLPPLARLLATLAPGARLPTMRELARTHGSSLFSVHMAMRRLEESGAIQVENRGRLGGYLVTRSLGSLWTIAERAPLVVALPLVSSRRYEGLATALKQGFADAGLEVFLIFARGSRRRLDALEQGRCNLIVMSSFAAHELCGPDQAVLLDLPPNTYNTGHRVFYSAAFSDERPVRYIVDRDSADQQLLSALEFGADGEALTATSVQIARMLEAGDGDAAVWTLDEMQVSWPRGVLDRPLSERVRSRIGDSDTRAALVGPAAQAPLLGAVASALDPSTVERCQADVLVGKRLPEY